MLMFTSLTKNRWLPLLFVVLGLALGYYILSSGHQKPVDHKKSKMKRVRTVLTDQMVKSSVVPFWNTSGFVIPAETVQINARVSGNIMEINPVAIPGGLIKKGQWLAKLETIDFELALKSEQAQLEQAKANFSLEKVDQILAKEELLLLNNQDGLEVDESLVLREPQLTMAKAKISVAQNDVEKAELNLARAFVFMPFDGKITNKNVGVGSRIGTGTSLFSVINTDVYWLEVKIPHKFLLILDKEMSAQISQPRLWGDDKYREARFVSILPELDTKDRQVKVLLAIDKPQEENIANPPVFINDFLNVELKGQPIENAWTIQHAWLQPDNTIWVVDDKNTLQKRSVDVLFKGRDLIYVNADIQLNDRALAEKPGIASIGMPVNVKRNKPPEEMRTGKPSDIQLLTQEENELSGSPKELKREANNDKEQKRVTNER